jgi:UPF0755 protein
MRVISFLNTPCLKNDATITFEVTKNTSAKKLAYLLKEQQVIRNPKLFYLMARWYQVDKHLQAGEYLVTAHTTPKTLLQDLHDGHVLQYAITVVEGSNFSQLLALLNSTPKIKKTVDTLNTAASNADFAKQLNVGRANLEGFLLPDTYYFTAGTSDIALLKRIFAAQQKFLQAKEVAERPIPKVLNNMYEVLILASIVEKETALLEEMPKVAGVYLRRLEQGIKLQADPTVIYGLGEKFNGDMHGIDLSHQSAYNTYLHTGLPPTPIAFPSRTAIMAVLNPEPGKSLYFVANGKGGHQFSDTLEEHNRAVAEYRKLVAEQQVQQDAPQAAQPDAQQAEEPAGLQSAEQAQQADSL